MEEHRLCMAVVAGSNPVFSTKKKARSLNGRIQRTVKQAGKTKGGNRTGLYASDELIKVLLPEQAPKMVKEIIPYIIITIIILIPLVWRIIDISRDIDDTDYESELKTLEVQITEMCNAFKDVPKTCEYCGADRGREDKFCQYCGVNFEKCEEV